MLFDNLDIHFVAPVDVQCIDGAAASGSIAARLDVAPDERRVFSLCSGFLISRRHVLTAAHCVQSRLVFDQEYLAPGGGAQSVTIVASGSTVRLLLDGDRHTSDRDVAELPALGDPLYQSPALDFAVFALPAPTSSRFVDLAAASTTPEGADTDSEDLRVYAYPNGIPLSESSHCRSFPSLLAHILLHDCDTLPGSSGGLLVSVSSGLGVAMHLGSTGRNALAYFENTGHFESPVDYQSMICDSPAEAPAQEPLCFEGPGYNRALKLTSVAGDIQRQAPSVWRSILDESSNVDVDAR